MTEITEITDITDNRNEAQMQLSHRLATALTMAIRVRVRTHNGRALHCHKQPGILKA